LSGLRLHDLPYRADCTGYFAGIRDLPNPVWLDSGRPALDSGRFDILAADPVETLRLDAGEARLVTARLRQLLGDRSPCPRGLPFCGGLIGFASYELGRAWMGLETLPRTALADDLYAALYDWALVVDHHRQSATLVGAGRHPRTRERWAALCRRFDLSPASAADSSTSRARLTDVGLDREAYASAFAQLQRYIHDGDTYQVNLTRRLVAEGAVDAWDAYRRLRAISPAPYGAFIDCGEYQVLSNSPEQFVSLQAERVQTRPIKGTRPRGATPQADARLRADLAASDKDRAENLMIVDLLRNDLGRVCVPGSIEVPQLFGIESYATVHHLVSTVTGRLRPSLDALDLLRACFPGGSITGAPKRRAMQIIDELEPVGRELYCGSVFRLGYDGNLDSSIAIRTLLKRERSLYYWAGGGVVADSQCEPEFRETLDKAAAFFQLLGIDA
jgi:para-aminobenzoate synthetase component I